MKNKRKQELGDRLDSGFVAVALVVILLVAALFGGVFYFLGSQNSGKLTANTKQEGLDSIESKEEVKATPTPDPNGISESLDSAIIEKELTSTELLSIDKDLADIDKEAKSFQ